ncbi:unnamed protein product [Bathycoccus prasinos]|mmetsp:Transcript_4770/g.15421  ORF Transcript_4770/g.15421 Transcript_4770/m.15421 type:complete len:415 (+) Transcript_4770:93-1337(+)
MMPRTTTTTCTARTRVQLPGGNATKTRSRGSVLKNTKALRRTMVTRRAGKHLYFSVEDNSRDDEDANIFDPLDILLLSEEKEDFGRSNTNTNTETLNTATRMMVMTTTVGYVGLTTDINSVSAGTNGSGFLLQNFEGAGNAFAASSQQSIDPFANFSPVCPASDGVFRVGQRLALSLAGDSNIENYRPLINDVLIRVRTELCVLESFVRETAIPFVQTKGLGWVLPRHETSETYLAGVVFVVGANFILLGSTKVVAILAIYHDLSVGLVARGMGGLLGFMSPGDVRKAREEEFEKLMTKQMEETKKVMLDANMSASEREKKTTEISTRYATEMEKIKSTQEDKERSDETSGIAKFRKGASVIAIPLKVYGTVSRKTREILEVFDTFCSRYFVAFTVTYIIVKTLHYVVFPDALG